MTSRLEQKALAAHRALDELRQAAMAACDGSDALAAASDSFAISWSPGQSPEELAEKALASAAECLAESQPVQNGRVYCYACRSAACEHAQPAEEGQVFAGYQPTGKPYWEEFFNYLLSLGDDRAERLFSPRPELLARVIGRRRLVAEQLESFGRNSLTYRVWGQVVAGYLTIGDQRMAFTVQLVENKTHQLRLQVLAPQTLLAALADAPDVSRSALHRVHEAIRGARRSMAEISHLWEARHGALFLPESREKAFAILRHLAHSIERKGRQDGRRTAHAEQRANQQRPVHTARKDLVQATEADFFQDRFRNSFIVLGKAGRAHAFNEEGCHITSFALTGDELERRLQRRRYQPLTAEEVLTFRQRALAENPVTGTAGENGTPAT
jgi:hypothetical protein